MLADDVENVLAVETAGLSQEGLGTVIVVVGPVPELPVQPAMWPDGIPRSPDAHVVLVGDGPAGEGAGTGFDVALGVVPDSHGK